MLLFIYIHQEQYKNWMGLGSRNFDRSCFQVAVNTGSGWANLSNSSPYSGVLTTTLVISTTNIGMSGNQYRCRVTNSCVSIYSESANLYVFSSITICDNDFSCGPPSPKQLPITSTCINTTCSTVGATPPSQDITFKSCAGVFYQTGRYDDDVWFSITPTNSSQITIKVTPTSNLSNFDPVIGLYTGNCLTPTQVSGGCADVYPSGGTEQLVFIPNSGTTYLIRVFGYGIGSAYSGNFDICVTTVGQAAPADLVISNVGFSTSSICAGDPLNISINVKNVGGTIAPSSTVKYYLSSNSTYSTNDDYLGSSSINNLSPNAISSHNKTLTIPSGTNAGNWYVLIIADFNNDVIEGTDGENNNLYTSSISVNNCSGSPDLVIEYISHTPTVIPPGTNVHVTHESTNIGSGAAAINKIGIYISADNNFDPFIDVLLNDWTQTSLDPGEIDNDLLNFKIPNCQACGTYFIFLVIDYQNIIPETNNNNNTDYFQIDVTGCISCSYSIPPTGINFQSAGGTGNLSVTTTACCPWQALSNDSWITIINGVGTGTGIVSYSVAPCNGGGTRTGSITVSGQSQTITQNCVETCNASQTFEWAQKAGSSTLSDAAADLALDATGNLYMTGDIQGAANFGGGIILTTPSTAPDIFISKHNSTGLIEWAIRYGNTNQEKGNAIAIDSNGDIYVAGSFVNSVTFGGTTLVSNSTNNDAAFLIKLNSSGFLLWAKKINAINIGIAYDLVIDKNNNIYVVGDENYSEKIFISKYNTSGDQLWYNTYGGAGTHVKNAFGITADYFGNIYICGRYMNNITLGTYTMNTIYAPLDIDGFISKLDNMGNVLWAKKLTSPGQGTDELRSVAVDTSNNIYVVGNVDSTAIIGDITIPLSPSSKEIVAKYDQDGNVQWAKASINGTQYNSQKIINGNDNDMYFCGDFGSSMQIDSFAITSAGSNDAFLIRIDENGKIKWMKRFGGTNSESGNGIATNSANDIFVAGGFYGTVAFGNTTLTSNGSEDIYLAKFKQCDPPVANITYNGTLILCSGQTLELSTSYCSGCKKVYGLMLHILS